MARWNMVMRKCIFIRIILMGIGTEGTIIITTDRGFVSGVGQPLSKGGW